MGGFSYLWMNTWEKNKWIQDCKVRVCPSFLGGKKGALFLKISPATWKAILWKADWHICFLIHQTQERIPFYRDKVTSEWRENWSDISVASGHTDADGWASGHRNTQAHQHPQLPFPAESPTCSPLSRFRFPFADAILSTLDWKLEPKKFGDW